MMRRVFISYSHDSEGHEARVHALVDKLRAIGMTVVIDSDMLPGGPSEGWPAWCTAQVKDADLVLVACTETYRRRYEGEEIPDTGLGVVWEAGIIRASLYKAARINEKFRVILFEAEDHSHVPAELTSYHRFPLYESAAYDQLLDWIRGPTPPRSCGAPAPEEIPWPSPAADYSWQLADRKPEFALFQKMVTGQSPQQILLVRGVSNTGKTVFFGELLAYARFLKLPAALLDFKGCPSLDDLFQTLLLDLGPEILPQAHSASGTARFFSLISDLQQSDAPILLLFDTYEQASENARKWLESQLLPRLDKAPGVVVLIGGQQIPKHGKYAWKGRTKVSELQPIQQVDEWLESSISAKIESNPIPTIRCTWADRLNFSRNAGIQSSQVSVPARQCQPCASAYPGDRRQPRPTECFA